MALALGVWPALDAASADTLAVSEQSGGTDEANRPIAFGIPAQPLGSALERYSAVSGWQVIYDGSLAADRLSAPVDGVFTPATALQQLLTGTGLLPHYTAADGFFLVPDPAAGNTQQDPLVNTASSLAVAQYYGHIQASLKRAFCGDDRARSGGYRVAVSFWMDASGTISRSALLGSTGNSDLDATIDRTVRSLAVGKPPPAGFAQPVILVVTPTLMQDCQATRDGVLPIRGEP